MDASENTNNTQHIRMPKYRSSDQSHSLTTSLIARDTDTWALLCLPAKMNENKFHYHINVHVQSAFSNVHKLT